MCSGLEPVTESVMNGPCAAAASATAYVSVTPSLARSLPESFELRRRTRKSAVSLSEEPKFRNAFPVPGTLSVPAVADCEASSEISLVDWYFAGMDRSTPTVSAMVSNNSGTITYQRVRMTRMTSARSIDPSPCACVGAAARSP